MPGNAGFGFSAVGIGLVSLWRTPSELVSIVFIIEVPASLMLLPQALRDFSAPWVKPLLGASVIGIPLGVGLLTHVQGRTLQFLVALSICVASLMVQLNLHPQHAYTNRYRWPTGVVSGILNGR